MVVAALCGAVSTPAGGAAPTSTPLSIVQLGDSIASGEGTLYQAPNAASPNGQLYFCLSSSDPSSNCYSYLHGYYNGYWMDWPSTSPARWTPAGSPTYPECHQSPDAYGQLVATADDARFTQLACTGASYLAGVTGSQSFAQGDVYSSAFLSPYTVGAPTVPGGGSATVPAQFGDIAADGTPSQVNAAYTSAKPNVVLLTLGADDLKFVGILTACIEWNYLPAAPQPGSGTTAAPYGSGYSGNLQCSDDNATDKKGPTGSGYPDGVIADYYSDQLQALHTHLTSLLTAIEKEGQQPGQSGPPKIVITNYPNPLPSNLPEKSGSNWASDYCPDTFPLYNAQIDYFSGLIDQLDTDIAGGWAPIRRPTCSGPTSPSPMWPTWTRGTSGATTSPGRSVPTPMLCSTGSRMPTGSPSTARRPAWPATPPPPSSTRRSPGNSRSPPASSLRSVLWWAPTPVGAVPHGPAPGHGPGPGPVDRGRTAGPRQLLSGGKALAIGSSASPARRPAGPPSGSAGAAP